MSRLRDYIAHRAVGTPAETAAEWFHSIKRLRHLRHYPELAQHRYQKDVINKLLPRLIMDGTHCADVGAHVGSFLSKIRRLSPSGMHVAVEALPHKARWLQRRYPEVEVHAVAVGASEDGVATLWHDAGRSGYSSLYEATDGAEPVEVSCWKLDDLLPDDRTFGFIKMDVEGAELAALAGAQRVLSFDRPSILFEYTPITRDRGITPDHVIRFFDERNYSVYTPLAALFGKQPLDANALDQATTYPFAGMDYIATPS